MKCIFVLMIRNYAGEWKGLTYALSQANEGEGSLPWDTFNHVLELVKNGNREFRRSKYSEVIS